MKVHVPETERTLPDRIADELIARIFTGEFAPGERLPAERTLATELGVDRTSLRAALRLLARMRVVRATRGSGITVLDFRKHAGLDFLTAVLEVPGLELGGAFLLEALELWNAAMPRLVATVLSRARPANLGEVDRIVAAQIEEVSKADPRRPASMKTAIDRAVELELELHDLMVDTLGDVTVRLAANSTRGLRAKLTRLQYELVHREGALIAQLEAQRALMRAVLAAPLSADELERAHATFIETHHRALRAHLASLPPRPYRVARSD